MNSKSALSIATVRNMPVTSKAQNAEYLQHFLADDGVSLLVRLLWEELPRTQSQPARATQWQYRWRLAGVEADE